MANNFHDLNEQTCSTIYANLVQMFYTRSRTRVITFRSHVKSKMAILASDWLRHFQFPLQNYLMDCVQTWHRCSTQGPTQVLLLFRAMKNPTLASDWLRHFQLFLKNYCIDCVQTWYSSSTLSPTQVLLLYGAMQNPRWLPWPLIGLDIFNFF